MGAFKSSAGLKSLPPPKSVDKWGLNTLTSPSSTPVVTLVSTCVAPSRSSILKSTTSGNLERWGLNQVTPNSSTSLSIHDRGRGFGVSSRDDYGSYLDLKNVSHLDPTSTSYTVDDGGGFEPPRGMGGPGMKGIRTEKEVRSLASERSDGWSEATAKSLYRLHDRI